VIWRIFIVLALLLVAGLTLFLGKRGGVTEQAQASREPPQPGYFMTDAEIVEMGTDGAPRYRVSAARIVQDPTDLSVSLKDMKLIFRSESQQQWTLTADSGFVPPGSRTIDLVGDVQVDGLPMQGTVPAVLRTERLKVDTVANLATTKSRVDIVWGNRRISSVGLKADLNDQKLQLESSVHGRFVR